MVTPYIGEIKAFGFGLVPRGWALCDGKILPISENPALASLLGNHYGGDGHTTFGLPDLRGRTASGVDETRGESIGNRGGTTTTTLTAATMPEHTHDMYGSSEAADQFVPTTTRMLAVTAMPTYGRAADLEPMADGTTTRVGQGAAFTREQPSQVINYCIAITGVYPPRP